MKYCNQCHATYPTDFNTCPKDQSVLVAAAELAAGMVLRGKYQIVEKIGAGGMATVYRVRHLHLKEDVAIKVVNPNLAGDPDFVERFQTEAVVTRKLRHPNAVRLDDFDLTDDGRPFIVMEFVQGKSLRSVIQNGWLAPARAASIARQVALALGAAHDLGIVHRDIKPENILLIANADGSDLVKVLDFGIARVNGDTADLAAGHTPTRTGIILGTPQYVSPEQAKGVRGSAIDGRSDLYSLGVVLYEMLTGELPFQADTPFDLLLHHIQTIPEPPHVANDHAQISSAMSAVVMKALEKDPARRFQSAAAFAEALTDPAVTTKSADSATAHAFSTAALAAAAASHLSEPPRSTVASAGPVRTTRATIVGGEPTVPMGSSHQPIAAAATKMSPRSVGKKSRSRWYASAAACVALALGGWGLWHGHQTAQAAPATSLPVAEATPTLTPEAEPTQAANRPVPRARRTAPRPTPRPTAEPVVSNGARAKELTAAGYHRLSQKDYDRARDDFEQALALDPNNASAKRGLQLCQGGEAVDTISGILRR